MLLYKSFYDVGRLGKVYLLKYIVFQIQYIVKKKSSSFSDKIKPPT